MVEYMRTLLNGLKVWVVGEVSRLRTKIDAVSSSALNAANTAMKNSAKIKALDADMDDLINNLGNVQTNLNITTGTANEAKNIANKAIAMRAGADRSFTADFTEDMYSKIASAYTFTINGVKFCKLSDFYVHPDQLTSSTGGIFSSMPSTVSHTVRKWTNCYSVGDVGAYIGDVYGHFIVIYGINASINGLPNIPGDRRGIWGRYVDDTQYASKIILDYEAVGLMLDSVTKDSTKRFCITVDDTGALSATEVTS